LVSPYNSPWDRNPFAPEPTPEPTGTGSSDEALTPEEIYANERAAIQAAWQAVMAADAASAQAAIEAVLAEAELLDDATGQRVQADVAHAQATGQISVARAQEILTSIQAKGTAYLDFLRQRGDDLLVSLRGQEANALEQFIEQTVYDLDRNRQITGENARIGYSGTRRFAVTPTEEQAMGLPGYEALQQNFAQRRSDVAAGVLTDTQLAQRNLDADVARAQAEVGLAGQQAAANVGRAGISGQASAVDRARIEADRISAQMAADQARTQAQMQRELALRQMEYERQRAAEAERASRGPQEMVGTESGEPELASSPTGYGYGNYANQGSSDAGSYQGYAEGGYTALARAVAARSRRGLMRRGR